MTDNNVRFGTKCNGILEQPHSGRPTMQGTVMCVVCGMTTEPPHPSFKTWGKSKLNLSKRDAQYRIEESD